MASVWPLHTRAQVLVHTSSLPMRTSTQPCTKSPTSRVPPSLISPGIENIICLQVLKIKTIQMFPPSFHVSNSDVFPQSTCKCSAARFCFGWTCRSARKVTVLRCPRSTPSCSVLCLHSVVWTEGPVWWACVLWEVFLTLYGMSDLGAVLSSLGA